MLGCGLDQVLAPAVLPASLLRRDELLRRVLDQFRGLVQLLLLRLLLSWGGWLRVAGGRRRGKFVGGGAALVLVEPHLLGVLGRAHARPLVVQGRLHGSH